MVVPSSSSHVLQATQEPPAESVGKHLPAANATKETIAKYLEPGSKKAEAGPRDESSTHVRICAVCMGKPISTAAMPCRHSSMCGACMEEVQQRDRRCPICRSRIDYVMRGDFEADFVDLGPRLMAPVARRVQLATSQAYNTMYENVKFLLLVGLLCAIATICCTSLGYMLPALIGASGATLIGYLPWFIVTVGYFENEERPTDLQGQPRSRWQAFLGDGSTGPAMLVCKIVLTVVLLPLALLLFLVPYAIFGLIVRPCFRHLVPCVFYYLFILLINVVIYSYMYVLRPIGSCLHCVGYSICASLYLLGELYKAMGRAVAACCRAVYNHVLTPVGMCFLCVAGSAGRAAGACTWAGNKYICTPSGQGLTWCAASVHNHALAPLGRGMWCIAAAICGALYNAMTAVAACIGFVAGAICKCLQALGNGCALAAQSFYSCCLEPTSRAISFCGSSTYGHVCKPAGRGTIACATATCDGITACQEALFRRVIEPICIAFGKCLCGMCDALFFCLSAICYVIYLGFAAAARCVQKTCGAFYKYVLSPIGVAVWVCLTAIFGCMASIFRAIFRNVIAPLGHAIYQCLSSVVGFVRSVCQSLRDCTLNIVLSVRNCMLQVMSDLRQTFR